MFEQINQNQFTQSEQKQLNHNQQLSHDVDQFPLSVYSKNPTQTLFRKIYSQRPTHYNRWLETYDYPVNEPIEITNLQSRNINMFRNFCVIINIPYNRRYNNKVSMVELFDHLLEFKLTFEISNTKKVILLDVKGNILHEIIKCDSDLYDRISDVYYKTNDLIIPLSDILFDKTWIPSYV